MLKEDFNTEGVFKSLKTFPKKEVKTIDFEEQISIAKNILKENQNIKVKKLPKIRTLEFPNYDPTIRLY